MPSEPSENGKDHSDKAKKKKCLKKKSMRMCFPILYSVTNKHIPLAHILYFSMIHTRYGGSIQHTAGQLTHTRRSDGAPEPDGVLQKVDRDKIRHYRQIYPDRPDPITFIPLAVDTSGRVYDDFNRPIFLNAHREASALANEIPRNRINFVFFTLLTYLTSS